MSASSAATRCSWSIAAAESGASSALEREQRLGVVELGGRVLRPAARDLPGRLGRLLELAEHAVGAREHPPALDVVRLILEAGGKALDHAPDHLGPLLRGHVLGRLHLLGSGPAGSGRAGRRRLGHHPGRLEAKVLGQCCDPLAHDRQIGGIGRGVPDQPGPEIQGLLAFAALDQGQTLKKRARGLAGSSSRARASAWRAASLTSAARGLDLGFGKSRLQLGAALVERQRAPVGVARPRRLADQLIGARQPVPALEVVRRPCDPLLELLTSFSTEGRPGSSLALRARSAKGRAGRSGRPRRR